MSVKLNNLKHYRFKLEQRRLERQKCLENINKTNVESELSSSGLEAPLSPELETQSSF